MAFRLEHCGICFLIIFNHKRSALGKFFLGACSLVISTATTIPFLKLPDASFKILNGDTITVKQKAEELVT